MCTMKAAGLRLYYCQAFSIYYANASIQKANFLFFDEVGFSPVRHAKVETSLPDTQKICFRSIDARHPMRSLLPSQPTKQG